MENVEISAGEFEKAVGDMAVRQNTWQNNICFVYLTGSGRVEKSPNHEVCYARILKYEQDSIKELVLFVPPCRRHSTKILNTRDYLNWIINSQMFGKAFITKDADEGFDKGFKIDTTQNRALVFGAMQAFRYGFETDRFGWSAYRKMGFNVTESLALASCYGLTDDGTAGLNIWCSTPAAYSEHLHINPRSKQFSCYLDSKISLCKAPPLSEKGSYATLGGLWFSGWSSEFWATQTRIKEYLEYQNIFGVPQHQSVNLNMQNATKLLEAIKQET